MRQKIGLMLMILFGLLTIYFVWGIVIEQVAVSKSAVTHVLPPPNVKRVKMAMPTVEASATATEIPAPTFSLKETLASETPIALMFEIGAGDMILTNWGKPVFYREDIPIETVMDFMTGGIQSQENADGTLLTLMHSNYYYGQEMFGTNLAKYVAFNGSRLRMLDDGKATIAKLVGKRVWLCQSENTKPLASFDGRCEKPVEFTIVSAGIVLHEDVEEFKLSMNSALLWMQKYQMTHDTANGFDNMQSGQWLLTTCLNQYNDQTNTDGTYSYEYNRFVIGLAKGE